MDTQRGRAADTLEQAAERLHAAGNRVPERVTQFTHSAADRLSATANYVRSHGAKDVLADVESYVKSHPAQALAIVAVAGFFAGRALRRI
jgi:ElaB/YqjD/DUF883 family membrane-anchored ribosome-binding protein